MGRGGLTASRSLPRRRAFLEQKTHEVSDRGKDICCTKGLGSGPSLLRTPPHPACSRPRPLQLQGSALASELAPSFSLFSHC